MSKQRLSRSSAPSMLRPLASDSTDPVVGCVTPFKIRRSRVSRPLLLGVDAGGSKTRVVLGEIVDGRVVGIGSAVGGAGNPRSVGFDSALATIDHTVERAFDSARLPVTMVSHACLSVAGAGRPEERQRILDWCASARIAAHASVVGDAECLLAAVQRCGVALIAGTGSM